MTPTLITHICAGTVQLNETHDHVPAGSIGYIVGRFARESPTYLVSFGSEGVIELRGDEITACGLQAA